MTLGEKEQEFLAALRVRIEPSYMCRRPLMASRNAGMHTYEASHIRCASDRMMTGQAAGHVKQA